LSVWPPQWNFDKQLQKQNQVPTCCVFRRDAWARLGGYRQRYAPQGCGAEDAEFWTRAGAYGWKARKVTEAGLFHYQLGGQVSGNREYHEPDWLAWHPWVKDGLHPFASYATPKRRSHPVRQYDEPVVSVVIPVGPGHEQLVIDALDSLEAQTFRKWEAIIVWDSDGWDTDAGRALLTAYPYVKNITTMLGEKKWVDSMGAGYARNRGAEIARAPFLVFLDADDWLHPNCLQKMLDAWESCQAIVYTDYVGKAVISDASKLAPDLRERIYAHDEKTGEALLGYRSAEYNCIKAQRQPDDPANNPYLWCNVTALIPKAWHDGAGGFDEQLPTWEDVEYHWRLARMGKPYQHIAEELMMYRLNTGTRRDEGGARQMRKSVIEYIRRKLEGIETMPCPGGCGKKVKPVQSAPTQPARRPDPFAAIARQDGGPVTFKTWDNRDITISDADMVRAVDRTGNRGDHRVIGNATRISYGYKVDGQEFLAHRSDLSRTLQEVVVVQPAYEPPPTESAPLPPPAQIAARAMAGALPPVAPPPKPAPAPLPPPPTFDPGEMTPAQVKATIAGMSAKEVALMLELEQAGKNRPAVIKVLQGGELEPEPEPRKQRKPRKPKK